MPYRLRLLFFAAVQFCATALCRAEGPGDNMTKEQAEGGARMVSQPAAEVAKLDVTDPMVVSYAAERALTYLVSSLISMQSGSDEVQPDAALVETYIRLKMRGNTGDLCRKDAGCKEYPADKHFAKAAQFGIDEIKTYVARLDVRLRPQHDRVSGYLERSRMRMLFLLKRTADTDRQPTPPTPGEERFLKMAQSKKQKAQVTQPLRP